MSSLVVAAVVSGAIIFLIGVFAVGLYIFRRTESDPFKNALELTKTIGVIVAAGFTFVFIDQQRQALSQAEYDLKVYQTFFDAANSGDTRVKLRTLNTMTTYRRNFLAQGSKLDNTLVALSKSVLDDQDVQAALAAPTNSGIAQNLANDRSRVIKGTIRTFESVLGPIEKMSGPERERWQDLNGTFVDLPFTIRMGFAKGVLTRVRVHRLAAPFFKAVFGDIFSAHLNSAIQTVDRVWNPLLNKPGAGFSGHIYGVAIDLNADTNQFGTVGDMDPRLVTVFKRNGFVWGGDWAGVQRNPMHFEVSTDALAGQTVGVGVP
ncbi:MAG TPA: M15 family metallopeptidase [Thermoanaerobaculia bacterium]|jgi:hypothetical protein|nr:M15 family metallopeptidase [Thermoanaerobaculia bacterium]